MTAGSSTKGPAFASLDHDGAGVGKGVRELVGPFEGKGQRAAMVDAEVGALGSAAIESGRGGRGGKDQGERSDGPKQVASPGIVDCEGIMT